MAIVEKTMWIENPHGIKIAVPESLYRKRIQQYGWKATAPEFVPVKKVYPRNDLYLNPEGKARRQALAEGTEQFQAAPISHVTRTIEEANAEIESEESREFSDKVNYRDLTWPQLRVYARARGLEPRDMKREDILIELDKTNG